MPASDIELTPDQISSFHEHGFLALDRITTAAEVEQLRPIFDDTFEGWREKTEFTPRDLADGLARSLSSGAATPSETVNPMICHQADVNNSGEKFSP